MHETSVLYRCMKCKELVLLLSPIQSGMLERKPILERLPNQKRLSYPSPAIDSNKLRVLRFHQVQERK